MYQVDTVLDGDSANTVGTPMQRVVLVCFSLGDACRIEARKVSVERSLLLYEEPFEHLDSLSFLEPQ